MARAREKRSRQWWSKAIVRWRRSQLSAREFARREGVALSTLYWWSSELSPWFSHEARVADAGAAGGSSRQPGRRAQRRDRSRVPGRGIVRDARAPYFTA
jgi:hypothetical protein